MVPDSSRIIRHIPLRELGVGLTAVLTVLAASVTPAAASQSPDDAPDDRSLSFPSGLVVTMSEDETVAITPAEMVANGSDPSYDTNMRQSDYFSSLGDFATSPYTPNGFEVDGQPVFYSLTYFGSLWGYSRVLPPCAITEPRGEEMRCARGHITFTFSEPVTDPVLHINNLGANSWSANNEWENQRQWVHAASMLTLDLDNSDYSGAPGLRLASRVGNLAVVTDGPQFLLDPSDSRLDGMPAITRTEDTPVDTVDYTGGAFGAGSVVVEGTWTSITFNRDLLWLYETYNPTNTPGRNYSWQAENECLLDQMPSSTMYFCTLTGQTWAPDQTKTHNPWYPSRTTSVAVHTAIQVDNPAPEGVSYMFTIDEDFGTAPTSYDGTDGASHTLSDLTIGGRVSSTDAELADADGAVNNAGSSGIASPNASGTDDDDDAFEAAPAIPLAGDYTVTIPLSGVTDDARLCAWIDADASGTFDTGERQCADVVAGASTASLTWPRATVDTIEGDSWMRIRLSYDLTGVESPTGRVASGEVEDWRIRPESPTTTTDTTTTTADTPDDTSDTSTSVASTEPSASSATLPPVLDTSLPATGSGSNLVPTAVALLMAGLGAAALRRPRASR
jgi:LPXTG-motif cell wall-anchored protein